MADGRDLEAAAVADRLKAFAADPSGATQRFLLGLEPLPAGGCVLRFAQGRFPAALCLTAADERELRAAAGRFVHRVCLADRADHYQVLCSPRDAPYEAIKENYHLLMALLHPDRQEHAADPWPDACAQRVNLAYATLGDEAMRREYDALIRAGRPAPRARMGQGLRTGRARVNEIRFAKTLIAVSAVAAALLAVALIVDDAEYRDRSLLHASLARLGASPVPGSEHPRYVRATAMAQPQRASDAVNPEDADTFSFLRPIMRALVPEAPKPVSAVPPIETIPAPTRQQAAPMLRMAPSVTTVPVAQSAQAAAPTGDAPPPKPAARESMDTLRPSNQDIESLVVALITYYEAGDADRLVALVDGGYWRTAQMHRAYADFFRATRARSLRVERLTWNREEGAAKAKGEAMLVAEYFDQTAPVQRRVDVEMDIAMREGRARITRLALFPER
jgi:curved DNA-binding protein CbpA